MKSISGHDLLVIIGSAATLFIGILLMLAIHNGWIDGADAVLSGRINKAVNIAFFLTVWLFLGLLAASFVTIGARKGKMTGD